MNENAQPLKMGQKRKVTVRRSGVGTGTTSLLMIFTVLCFATLAMLSLSTAASNERIQQRGVDGARNLAAAKGEAAQHLAELDAGLLALQNESLQVKENEADRRVLFEEAWKAEYPDIPPPLETPETFYNDIYHDGWVPLLAELGWEETDEEDVFTLRLPVDDETVLVTAVRVLPLADESGARYELISQQSGPGGGWQPEAGGNLWVPG